MFVYREEYYLSRAEPKQRADENDDKFYERVEKWKKQAEMVHNVAEVIIAKQRHGPIGTVALQFDGMITRFSDLQRDDYLPTQTQ
jgi:replicative DNA helicase